MNHPKIPLATAGLYNNVNLMNISEQLELRRKFAKRINQRMVRLEKKGLYQKYSPCLGEIINSYLKNMLLLQETSQNLQQ